MPRSCWVSGSRNAWITGSFWAVDFAFTTFRAKVAGVKSGVRSRDRRGQRRLKPGLDAAVDRQCEPDGQDVGRRHGKQLLILNGQGGFVYSVAWLPDGKQLAVASADARRECGSQPRNAGSAVPIRTEGQ